MTDLLNFLLSLLLALLTNTPVYLSQASSISSANPTAQVSTYFSWDYLGANYQIILNKTIGE